MKTWRLAQPSDSSRILPLMRAYYLHDHLPFEAERIRTGLEELLGDSSLGKIWLVEEKNKEKCRAVGYLALTFGFALEAGGRAAYVDEFFLDPESRGQGLGEKLLSHVIDECARLGIRFLRLEVTGHNERAMNLYRRLGFEDLGRSLLAHQLKKDPALP